LAAVGSLHVDFRTGHVRWQQIWRKLHARELGGEILGERFDGARLGKARQALDQEVAVCQ
jgi:hypothetical protein